MTDDQFHIIRDTLQAMRLESTERFARIETRLDGIDTRLDGIDKRIDGIDRRIDAIEGRIATQLATVADKGYAYRAAITVNGAAIAVIALVATALRTFGFV